MRLFFYYAIDSNYELIEWIWNHFALSSIKEKPGHKHTRTTQHTFHEVHFHWSVVSKRFFNYGNKFSFELSLSIARCVRMAKTHTIWPISWQCDYMALCAHRIIKCNWNFITQGKWKYNEVTGDVCRCTMQYAHRTEPNRTFNKQMLEFNKRICETERNENSNEKKDDQNPRSKPFIVQQSTFLCTVYTSFVCHEMVAISKQILTFSSRQKITFTKKNARNKNQTTNMHS